MQDNAVEVSSLSNTITSCCCMMQGYGCSLHTPDPHKRSRTGWSSCREGKMLAKTGASKETRAEEAAMLSPWSCTWALR